MEARSASIRILASVVVIWAVLGAAKPARAQPEESDIPETSIVPEGESTPPAQKPPPPAAHRKSSAVRTEQKASTFEVEPGEARVKIITDTPVFSGPSKSSKPIETAQTGKVINVTGSTHYFLRVKLKSGQTGYLEPSAVDLVKPADKIFALTSDAAVLEKPNRWGKKLSEVHKGHDVHVIGVALNYTKIRMKSGLEGFIPMKALE